VDLLSSRFAAPGLTTKDAINIQPSLQSAVSALLGRLAADDTKGRQHILDLYTAAKDHILALRECSPSKALDQLIADFADGMEQLLKRLPQHKITGINART